MQPSTKMVQAVVSVTKADPFVHFNLACGHMITEQADGRPFPPKMECWACLEEKKKP